MFPNRIKQDNKDLEALSRIEGMPETDGFEEIRATLGHIPHLGRTDVAKPTPRSTPLSLSGAIRQPGNGPAWDQLSTPPLIRAPEGGLQPRSALVCGGSGSGAEAPRGLKPTLQRLLFDAQFVRHGT